MALFQYWNYNRFQNPFRIDREELMSLSKIGSKNTYHKCMKELHTYRYIIYHSGIAKYQHVKVSMMRLETKKEEPGLRQLDLFNTVVSDQNSEKQPAAEDKNLPENGPGYNGRIQDTGSKSTASKPAPSDDNLKQVSDGNACIKNDTHQGTINDTHQSTTIETPTCTGIGTACVPVLTAACPKNGTVYVPQLGHNIKHKQINILKQCVYKTEKNTHTIIFQKNKKLENAITNLVGINNQKSGPNQEAPPAKNQLHPARAIQSPPPAPTGLNLLLVEEYFREQNFPIPEAQKFFYYNQGRGWMLTSTLPMQDWQAFAQKWMLNSANQKNNQNGKSGPEQKQAADPRPGKDYSEPL